MQRAGRGNVLAVVGPTASGKSGLAVELALRLRRYAVAVEIINADSMQLYRGMDIGTAKISPTEQRGVRHHLLDVWPLDKSAAVAEYQAMARAAIHDVHARGGLPLLVGGSGLYVRATLDHLEFPGEAPEVRAELTAELDMLGPMQLHRRLARLDPTAALAILPTNGRRIVRALEVISITGGPFMASMPAFDSIYDTVHIGTDRSDLDARVDERVTTMMDRGLLDEVTRLSRAGLRDSPTAGKALGYAQLLAIIAGDGSVCGDLAEAVAITQRATRRFVRRQRSWFRRDPRIAWFDAADPGLVDRVLDSIVPTLVR